ncbi:Ig-like domain-containing protein [Clostridium sp.]|uniref:Ig-like domain-containing protein n=1 Tax=Clostridium sp. TaxID=1506 RepID=UPI002FC8DB72
MNSNLSKAKRRVIACLTMLIGIIILVLSLNFVKNIIISNKIRTNFEQGSTNLTLGKADEAKECFKAAISLNKENKETYIFIKDEYLKAGRLDDALSVLKEGKNNNIPGLESFIEDIKKKFQVATLEDTIYQNEIYNLSQQVMIKINNEDMNVAIKWKDTKIETDKLGDFVFEGMAEEYERTVKLTVHVIPKIIAVKGVSASIIQGQEYSLPLKVTATYSDKTTKEVDVKWTPSKVDTTILGLQEFVGTVQGYEKELIMQVTVKPKAIEKAKQIGYISKTYVEGGKRYLTFDEVAFLTGEEAIKEAIKDQVAVFEDGEYYVPNGYYILNKSQEVKSFVIADNASLNLLGCWIDPYDWDISNKPVSYDLFSSICNNRDYMLCYIYTENNVVVKVEGQYTP